MEQLQPETKSSFSFPISLPTLRDDTLKSKDPLHEIPRMEAPRKAAKMDVINSSVLAIWSIIGDMATSANKLRRTVVQAKRTAKPRKK